MMITILIAFYMQNILYAVETADVYVGRGW
jgi:hypothetical protein